MNSNLDLEKLTYLSKLLELWIINRTKFEEARTLYELCTLKSENISKKIQDLNSFNYPSNTTFNVAGYELEPNRALQLQILKDQQFSISQEIHKYLKKFTSLGVDIKENLSNIKKHLISLKGEDLINYFDIDTLVSEEKNIIADYILTNTLIDLTVLYSNNIKLPSSQLYRGKISIMEMIIAQKNICESKISEYYELKQKIHAIQESINGFEINRDKALKKLSRFDLDILRKILNKKEYEYLKEYVNGINIEINYSKKDKYLKDEELKELEREKIKECYKYIKICENIDELIDALGEKSLRELITKLNVIIPKTDNNYFNEKEEMRIVLKKWFEEENKKITEEINLQTIEEKIGNNKELSKSR